MPILIYRNSEGKYQEQELSDQKDLIRIGSDSTNDIVLPSELGVAPQHAVVLRSAANQLTVLVDLVGQDTRVNGRQIESIRVLRQQDSLQLGQASPIEMWEIRFVAARPGDRSIGQVCQVCSMRIQAGDEVVICPRCSTPSHRLCWLELSQCPKYTCNYPIHDSLIAALSSKVTFERSLDASSELLKNKKKCQYLVKGQQLPFLEGDDVAYCPSPSCRAPYHVSCWLHLEYCTMPNCGFAVQQLIDHVFSVGDSGAAQTGEFNVK